MTDMTPTSPDLASLLREAVTTAAEKAKTDTSPPEAGKTAEPENKPGSPQFLKAERPGGAESAGPKSQAAALFALRLSTLRAPAAKLRWPAAAAAGVLLSTGIGYGVAQMNPAQDKRVDIAEAHWNETAETLRQSREETARLAGELKLMRLAVDGVRGERERARGDLSSKQAQLNDRLEKAATETSAKVVRLTEQVDRMEKTQRDPSRIALLVERLDRIEKQTQTVADKVTAPPPPPKPALVSAAPAAPPADTVTQTGSLAEIKTQPKPAEVDPRKTPLEGYVLRDVDDGVALVEARNGRMIELQPGRTLGPGNRVEAIERRGRQWVVVTTKGFIGERWP